MDMELLIPIIAIVLGSLMFLIPIAGLTARFAFKPIIEGMARMKELQATGSPDVRLLEERVNAIEQQLQGMDVTLQRLAEARDFERQLSSGRS